MTLPLRVFITGASSGIGAALAWRYQNSAGATLGLVARGMPALEALNSRLGGTHALYAADVADIDAMQAAAREFMTRFGVPDIVIANAGISVGTSGGDSRDLPVLERIWKTNVLGVAASFQPFIEPMRTERRGSLVGIASIAGFRGLPGAGAYSSSKAALIAWLEALRIELHGSGVAVITICPGFIDTPMTQSNAFPMPFMLDASEAARRIVRVIERRKRFCVVPWQMGVAGYVAAPSAGLGLRSLAGARPAQGA